MNCRTFDKRLVELLDTQPDSAALTELLQHAEACPTCARELEEARATLAALRPSCKTRATPHFKERVMETIRGIDAAEHEPQQTSRRSRLWRRLGVLAAAAVMCFITTLGYNWYAARHGRPEQSAFAVLAQAAVVMKGIQTLHIKAMMRTPPRDNFESISLDDAFIPVDLWKQYGTPSQYRVEKAERVITNDGRSGLLLIKNGAEPPTAVTSGPDNGFIEWLKPLLNADTLFDQEQQLARKQGSKMELTNKKEADGTSRIVLKIEAQAQGNFSQSDYAKDKAIIESDHIRIYTFDEPRHRLMALQVLIKTAKDPVLVFETAKIEYDQPLDAALFSTKAPDNAFLDKRPWELPNVRSNSAMSPKAAVEAFFKACAEENWDEARNYCGTMVDRPNVRQGLGGLKILKIGEPVKSGVYRGWIVPYEIQLKSGETKKWNLGIRNDNPKKQWEVDGGI